MKLEKLVLAQGAIEALYGTSVGVVKFKARKALKLFIEELKDFNEAKQSIIDKYKDDDGTLTEESDNYEEADAELQVLLAQELEVTCPSPLELEGLEEVEIDNFQIDLLVDLGIIKE